MDKLYVIYDLDQSRLVPQDGHQRIFGGKDDTRQFFKKLMDTFPSVHYELMSVKVIEKSWR